MPDVIAPPIGQIQRLRRLNGVIPHASHPQTLAMMANSLYGWVSKGAFTVHSDDSAGITNLAQVRFDVPIRGGVARASIAVLAGATAAGRFDVSFTSGGDAVGVQVTVDDYEGVAPSLSTARWWGTGFAVGDVAAQERRALVLADGGSGTDTVVYAGHASVRVWAIRVTPAFLRSV